MRRQRTSNWKPLLGLAALVVPVALLGHRAAPSIAPAVETPAWRHDPAWHQGKAEWALYEAVRPIYGVPRRYEATIFTNKQRMDRATSTKSAGTGDFEVFKHNVSELVPTENYTYRFLTTSFIRTDDLQPSKIVAATQEDCGATYKQFVVAEGQVRADSFCYFPGSGERQVTYPTPPRLAFHDALTLTLRDYPFQEGPGPTMVLQLVPDQTDTHETPQRPDEARVTYAGRETLSVPFGSIDTHHLRVSHPPDGGATSSDYWFAADPSLRHVLVQYAGPYGVRYQLRRLEWWAYWYEPRPN